MKLELKSAVLSGPMLKVPWICHIKIVLTSLPSTFCVGVKVISMLGTALQIRGQPQEGRLETMERGVGVRIEE